MRLLLHLFTPIYYNNQRKALVFVVFRSRNWCLLLFYPVGSMVYVVYNVVNVFSVCNFLANEEKNSTHSAFYSHLALFNASLSYSEIGSDWQLQMYNHFIEFNAFVLFSHLPINYYIRKNAMAFFLAWIDEMDIRRNGKKCSNVRNLSNRKENLDKLKACRINVLIIFARFLVVIIWFRVFYMDRMMYSR